MRGISIDDLIRIAAAGGGFQLDAVNFEVGDLIRMAAASGSGGGRLDIRGGELSVNDRIRIASAGKGSVFFIP